MLFTNFNKKFKYTFFLIVSILILFISYFYIYGNFHKVDKNVYRSAQLFRFNLPYYIKKYKIKSILNLRGEKLSKKWYIDELSISKEYNITHYDYKLKSRSMVSIDKINDVLHIIKNAPKPLLIHCKAGADRTSLVSALYLLDIKHDTNAQRELSIKYGHFPWFGSKTFYMDKSFYNYKKYKKTIAE